jgi:hypothetical protein
MAEHSVVAVYRTLGEAEAAVRALHAGGFPIQQVSIFTYDDRLKCGSSFTSLQGGGPVRLRGRWRFDRQCREARKAGCKHQKSRRQQHRRGKLEFGQQHGFHDSLRQGGDLD